MDDLRPVEQLRLYRSWSNDLTYGELPTVEFSQKPKRTWVGIMIITVVAAFFIDILFGKKYNLRLGNVLLWGFVVSLLYWVTPFFSFVLTLLKTKKLPDKHFLKKFSFAKKLTTAITLSYFITLGLHVGLLKFLKPWWHLKAHREVMADTLLGIFNQFYFFLVWGLLFLAVVVFAKLAFTEQTKVKQKKRHTVKPPVIDFKQPFGLWIGESTGWLSYLYHNAGIAPKKQVSLALSDAAQNILILGAIGSGKTTRAMHPLLLQLLDQDCGGLIFDIKGDFQKAVEACAENTKREVVLIGPKFNKMNLLAGLTPEVAASFLKSIFMFGNQSDSFWVDTATELCRNTLGLLSFLPEFYSLNGLYSYLFDLETKLAIEEALAQIDNLSDKEKRLLASYSQYHSRIFDHFDEKVKAGVNATIAQVLAPFNHPDLVDAFCSEDVTNVHMEDVLNGTIYLVMMPLSIWGLGGKVVYTLIKLRFFNVMQQRATRTEWNQERPVFFMCDEFQEIVSANRDGLSDLNFWDKSRSSKTIGIISAQAVSSFYASIGNRDIAHALLQNFRQKICFKTEDITTLEYFNNLAAKVEVAKKIHSQTRGSTKTKMQVSNSDSYTENITYTDKPVLDAQLFRSISQNQAVALLSICGNSMDDVVNTMCLYV